VHPITKDVIPIDDDVALVYADPEFDAPVLRHLGVPLYHPPLHLDSAPQGIHHAGELDQHPVSGCLYDPSTVFGDLGVYQLSPMGLELRERALFVSSHEPTVTSDISRQDGCETTSNSLVSHGGMMVVCSHAVITPADRPAAGPLRISRGLPGEEEGDPSEWL